MADNYRKNIRIEAVPDRDDPYEEQLLEKQIERRRRRRRKLIIAAAVLLLAGLIGMQLFRRWGRYSAYSVAWQKDVGQGTLVGYEPFGNGFLKYSRDGATFYSGRGTENWVDTYEMKNPMICVSGSYAVIADRQGNDVRIYNEDGKTGETATILPLTRAAVASNGVTAVIEEDASAAYIRFMNKDGTDLDITVKAVLSGDGYPTDISLSPDGTRLMVSYEYLNGSDLKGRVVFYDFSEIGKNIPNRLVGGFDEPFADSLLAEVRYLNDTWSFSASSSGLCFFSSRNLTSPELKVQVDETDEIRTLFYNNEYVGVIMNNTESVDHYRLELYKPDGSKVMEKRFDDEYLYASVDGDCVFLTSGTSGLIFNTAGVTKFRGALDFPVYRMRKGTSPGEFLMAGPVNLKGVRLR